MPYDEKDAVCLFKLRDWNNFIGVYKEQLKEYYEKECLEEMLKTVNDIDKALKEKFLC